MAHTVFITRGEIIYAENFIKELSTRYVRQDRYDKQTGKMEPKIIKLRVCPVQLWDLSYPKECRDYIHNTLFSGGLGEPINKNINKFVWAAQKAMKLQPIEESKDKITRLPMNPVENVEVIGIGTKEDYWEEPDGKHVREDEKSELATEGI